MNRIAFFAIVLPAVITAGSAPAFAASQCVATNSEFPSVLTCGPAADLSANHWTPGCENDRTCSPLVTTGLDRLDDSGGTCADSDMACMRYRYARWKESDQRRKLWEKQIAADQKKRAKADKHK